MKRCGSHLFFYNFPMSKLKTKVVQGIEVHLSSGNVFADLELPDAEQLKIKANFLIELRTLMLKSKSDQVVK